MFDMKVYLPEWYRGKSRGNVYMQSVGGESKQKLEKSQKAMDWRVCEWDDIG
jgi:hypothetical protein